jgi:uncharacterized protein
MPFQFKYLNVFFVVLSLLATDALMAAPDDDARAAYDQGDYATAHRIWSELAEQNDGRAQYALGVMHATGNGRDKDQVKAFEWFEKAAQNGHLKAMYNLGIAYWTGQGAPENREEAARWWRSAAERGDVVSQYNLGVAYYNGLGVEQDLVEAARWIRSAAEQDYETARELLPALEEKIREAAPANRDVAESTAESPASGAASPATVAATPSETTREVAPEERTIAADFTAAFITAGSASVHALNRANAPVIETLGEGVPVKVIDSGGGWTKVEAPDGFKLWVFGTYVEGDGDNARISGQGVRARSLPSTAEQSISPGRFKDNDRVKVLKTEGQWKYVQAPSHLHAWIKSDQLSVLPAPTESWAEQWRRSGGSL